MKSAGILIVLFLLPAAAVLFYLAGPSIDRSCDFSYPNLPESPAELESYFAARESSFSDLRPGTEKKIVWADRKSGAGGKNMAKTGFSIIYLHGFTASRMVIRRAKRTENP